jgi:tRNA dimethylallyltransferase
MATKDQRAPVMITILGPTATGKTRLAAYVAAELNGEIISADSRQVYRGMDIGTGKDLKDYVVHGHEIPSHLVDIVDAGYEYNVYEFQQDFLSCFKEIVQRGKLPILCGGTGMYLESVLSGYRLINVPEDPELRFKLETKTDEELNQILQQLRPTHNTTDTTDRNRTIRAIEIASYQDEQLDKSEPFPEINHRIFGVNYERHIVRHRITSRLKQRLEEGMIDEVKTLLGSGLKPEQLTFYGLEYRYLTDYITGKISYQEMFKLLNTAIHQFSKRQMTWFRRMEKKGIKIHWIDGGMELEEKVKTVLSFVS